MVLLSAFLFSGKAILAKLIYRELPLPVIDLLLMRMLYAAPFYGLSLWLVLRKKRDSEHPFIIPRGIWLAIAGLGLLGYYISSFLDFWGLQFVSAGLERVILFAYPALVVLLELFFFREKLQPVVLLALLLCYGGIAISFSADLGHQSGSGVWQGSLAILLCAFTFALYMVFASRTIPRVGVAVFTPVAMLAATTGIAVHAIFFAGSLSSVTQLPAKVHAYLAIMGVFATVVPSYLTTIGMQWIGSSRVAIVSSVGPMATIFLAWWLLQEPFGWLQFAGTVLVVGGVLLLSLKGKK